MTTNRATNRGPIAALFAGVLIYGLAMGTSYPLLALAMADDFSAGWNGVSVAATGLGFMAGVLVLPILSARFGAGTVAAAGMVLLAFCLVALSVIRDFWPVFGLRFLLGLSSNLMFVMTETGLNVLASPRSRGRVFGLYAMLTGLGFVVGPTLVAFFGDRAALLFVICALLAGLATLPYLTLRRTLDRLIEPARSLRLTRSVSILPAAFGLLFIASAVDAVMITLFPIIAVEAGFTASQGALYVAVFHAGLVASQPVVGWLLDCFGRRRTVLACLALNCAGPLILAIEPTPSPIVMSLIMFIWGGSNYGLYTAGLTMVGDRFRGAALAAATGSFALVYAVAATVTPLVLGFGLQAFSAVGIFAATAIAYGAALVWTASRFRPMEPASAVRANG